MKTCHSRTALTAALLAAAAWTLTACGGANTTRETIERATEETAQEEAAQGQSPEPVALVEMSRGTFDLTLTGTLENELTGVAVCTHEAGADELTVSMQPEPPRDLRYELAVDLGGAPEKLDGEFEASGARRWAGPVEVTRAGTSEATGSGFDLTFHGTYSSHVGGGEVEGSVVCPPLKPTEPTT
jgi:hypothetical protein